MKSFYSSKLAILIALLSGFTWSAFAQTSTFNWNGSTFGTGSVQTMALPPGVGQIYVDAKGGAGGAAYQYYYTETAMAGGRVQCTLNIPAATPTLYVYVGGAGQNCQNFATATGGWNGGQNSTDYSGGSGGESDIRLTNGSVSATNALMVAGAAGGGGDYDAKGGLGGGTTGGNGNLYYYGGCCAGAGGGPAGPGSGGGTLGAQGLGGAAGTYCGSGGAGWWGGNAGTGDASGGGGSSWTNPTLTVGTPTHTQGYSGATGNGQVIVTILCYNAGAIVGNTGPVCPTATLALTNPTAGLGTWSSSNSSVASVNAATGLVTGVTSGTATITYNVTNACGGPTNVATTVVTVNPLPGPITGTTNACTTFSTTLSDAGGGTWVSSNPAVGSISVTGVVSGLTAGVTTISYTLPTGCAPATQTVTINAFPPPIGGTLTTCAAGGTTALSDGLSGGTWNSTNAAVANVGAGSGVVTGVTAGTAIISYTAPTGCVTSSVVTINPLPAAIGGGGSVCVGSTTTVTDVTGGGTWTSSNSSQATVGIGTGIVTGVVAGTPSIIYTLASTGCSIGAPIVVNPLPASISSAGNVCVAASTSVSDAGGGTWSSSNTSVATVNAFSGSVTGVSPGIASINYTLGTGCSASSSMLVNPLPTPYGLTGGGAYCFGGSGVRIGVVYGASGVDYVLYNGASAVTIPTGGTNAGLDLGLQAGVGTYTVIGTNVVTGCSASMIGSVSVSVNPAPAQYNVGGGGSYCPGTAGAAVTLDGSRVGIQYQLYNGATPAGAMVPGSGTSLNFGLIGTAGTYTVLATNPVSGCTSWQAGSTSVSESTGPTIYNVTGGGSYCATGSGMTVGVGPSSDIGTNYQLFYAGGPLGFSQPGSGAAISFGLESGSGMYTVVATDGSGCVANMAGSATVIIDPVPAANTVTGSGAYCAGSPGPHVGLSFSTPGINYQLIYLGGVAATVGGSGSGLDFGAQTATGTYTVIGINSITGCSANMSGSANITQNPLPFPFNVLGSGAYCAGSGGFDVTTDVSESGISYQLYKGGVATGSPIPGTNLGLDFGTRTAGIYTVNSVNTGTGCATMGSGSAVVTSNPLPALHAVTGGGAYCAGGLGANVALSNSSNGVFYALMTGGGIVTTLSGTGAALNYGLQATAGTYTVVATDSTTGCVNNMPGSAIISINPLPITDTVTGGGNICLGDAGSPIGLNSSSAGISYQLLNGSSTAGTALSGSGSALSFGLKSAGGIYTVQATNVLTGCTATMANNATVNVNMPPMIQTMGGGGNYCAGGTGADVNLTGSESGVSYTLYRDGVPMGLPFSGTGTLLDFGFDTFGVYTVTALNSSGCHANMSGSTLVTAISPVHFTVTGGGNYCPGGTGVIVAQTGSTPGVKYTLMSGGSGAVPDVYGTGLSLSFGHIITPGAYTVLATDTTSSLGCTSTMTGGATVGLYTPPAAQSVTGGGSFCAGTAGEHVGLGSSVSDINYTLYKGGVSTGTSLTGTGGSLDYGLETAGGTYTVKATDPATSCSNTMTGNAVLTIIPTPTPYTISVDNFGNYCAADSGLHVRLANSQAGDNYQLFIGSTTVGGVVTGTGSGLDMGLESTAGSYTVVASDPSTACTSNMTGSVMVNIIPLPIKRNVTGGGGFCPGGAGVNVGLDGSSVGVSYQLYKNTDSLVATTYGTGSPLDFGMQPNPGMYTVIGNSQVTFCQNMMLGSANVFNDTIPTPAVTLRAFPGTGVGVWHIDSMKAYVNNGGPNPTYQWYVNGHAIAGATGATFINYSFFTGDIVTCQVTGSGPCGGNTATSAGLTIRLSDVGVGQVSTSGADLLLVPNPNKGAFTLKGNLGNSMSEEVTLEVTNMVGQVLYNGKASAVNGAIDTHVDLGGNLANGMYLLNVSSGTQRTVFHFVIEQ